MPYISIKGKKMFYMDLGEGFPLLFGHSYLWDTNMWRPQIDELNKSYRCIVPDLWGHGRSDSLPNIPYSIEELTDDYSVFINALGLNQLAIIGLSVGGMWATHMALKFPDVVKALILMGTHVGTEPQKTKTLYFSMLDMIEEAGKIPLPLIEKIVPLFFSPETILNNSSLVNQFKESLSSLPSKNLPSIIALGRAIFSRNSLLDNLPEILAPTLFITGSDDRSRPPHESQEMAQRIKNAQVEIIDKAGHISNLERSGEVTNILKSFLKDSL